MSDTRLDSGSNPTSPRQLLTAVAKAPRRLLITGLTSLLALAGAAALFAAPTAANASTLPPPAGNLPGCILPAGVYWQLTSYVIRDHANIRLFTSRWHASANGLTYGGLVGGVPGVLAPDVAVAEGLGTHVTCNVS